MVAYANTCACITLKGRRCKKVFSFVCNNARVCYIHANAYLKYVLTIQKAYKGHRCRKYVRLLARLPCDIQRSIVFYIREPLYNARRNNRIQNILCKRFVTIFGIPKKLRFNFATVFLGEWRTSILTMNKAQFNDHILYITHLYKLYTKYFIISSADYNDVLYIISNIVQKDIEECLYYYHHSEEPYLYTNAELLVLYKNVFELQKSIGIYNFHYKDCLG